MQVMAKLSYGSCYFSTPASTTLSAGTPVKAAGTTTTMQLGDFTHSGSNRLTYTGVTARVFNVAFAGSVTKGSGGSTLAEMYLYKNGTLIPGADVLRLIANASDEGAAAVMCQVSLTTNDYVELWIETDTGDDLTIEAGVLSANVLG
ncbi:unnamed protein product [marine sediment metagenome]|uniref:Uncharacterized protein n=1 Tax=marine sediment metagenome TaxID=412755 RepID=X1DLY3_9ZZZZ